MAESEKMPHTFFGYSEICFALEIATENDRLLKNLTIIDFDKGSAASSQAVSLKSMQAAQKKFAEGITISINIKDDSNNKIKSSFQDIFSKYGFKTSASKKEKYGIEGRYSSDITKKGKLVYCVYSLYLDFSDFSGKNSLFAINLKGREGAPAEADAVNRTFRVLEKKIGTEFSKNFDSYMNNLSFK